MRIGLRATQLVPHAPAPLVNLVAAASARQDYPAAQHYITQLGDLLSSGHLRAEERSYLCRRLAEHPKLFWLRDTDAWRVGPARWIRASRSARSVAAAAATAVTTAATAALVLLILLIPRPAAAVSPSDAVLQIAAATTLGDSLSFQRGRGGDSMGKPPKKLRPGRRVPEAHVPRGRLDGPKRLGSRRLAAPAARLLSASPRGGLDFPDELRGGEPGQG